MSMLSSGCLFLAFVGLCGHSVIQTQYDGEIWLVSTICASPVPHSEPKTFNTQYISGGNVDISNGLAGAGGRSCPQFGATAAW
ncbi:hypothetical protein BN1723_016386 [Verticillium longisporum]|uniref:Secreted protein n=1 Tax=Verticillium longisporum TaxID=100787 RepID=A0A0G4NDY6_VERLO|nr:hypothetical protein BN1723_016386 [Verticillium longisporum]